MATINIPNFDTQKTMVGLNTYQYAVQTAGIHKCSAIVSDLQTSGLTVTISQSGSVSATIATATEVPLPQPNTTGQSSRIIEGLANCQVGDVISFTLTSSQVDDQQLNTVKLDMIITRQPSL